MKKQKRRRKETPWGWGWEWGLEVGGSRATGGRNNGEDKHIFRNIFVCVLTQEPTKIAGTEHLGRTEQRKARYGPYCLPLIYSTNYDFS